MAVPAAAPKKPANQGGKAPANVSNTNALPHQYGSTANSWTQHSMVKQPGGTRGTGKVSR
jgi:hypothetical protein